jgi:glycerophosphoryl diester phosphodiesterase
MESRRPTVWISHRGYCNGATENTRLAFELAVKQGFCALETDLRMTQDGHIVLSHDPSFLRLGGPATKIADMTKTMIEKISFRDGSAPLFFDEFIESFAGCSWTFDIKSETGFAVIEALATWAARRGTLDWFLSVGQFLFWSEPQRAAFSKKFPGARIYASERSCWRAGVAAMLRLPALSGIRKGYIYSIKSAIFGYQLFTPRVVDFYQSRGVKVLAYLPESDDLAVLAEKCGFDEILTGGRYAANP